MPWALGQNYQHDKADCKQQVVDIGNSYQTKKWYSALFESVSLRPWCI
jgi:hypothetical protein